jgi:hypothetical protein
MQLLLKYLFHGNSNLYRELGIQLSHHAHLPHAEYMLRNKGRWLYISSNDGKVPGYYSSLNPNPCCHPGHPVVSHIGPTVFRERSLG